MNTLYKSFLPAYDESVAGTAGISVAVHPPATLLTPGPFKGTISLLKGQYANF